MKYKITFILSEKEVDILKESLTNYKGKNKLTADCIIAIIKRQVEIQETKPKEQQKE